MSSPIIVTTNTDLKAYSPTSDVVYWLDSLKGGMFSYFPSTAGYVADNGIVFTSTFGTAPFGVWVRQYEGDIMPQWFGINGDGKIDTANTPDYLKDWMEACKRFNKRVYFPEGTFCLPMNFQHDFGNFDLEIAGVRNKTIITSYEMGSSGYVAATNFAVPAKLDVTKRKPESGVYQIDIKGPAIHSDFSTPLTGTGELDLGAYVNITTSGVVSNLTLAQVKALGYVTELDVTVGDPGVTNNAYDGLYVVSKHTYFYYAGGFAHLNLKYVNGINSAGGSTNFNVGSGSPNDVWYVQGTILKRTGSVWSRYFSGSYSGVAVTSGGGFCSMGNMIVKDIIFDNTSFYLFSPFNIQQPQAHQTSDIFSILGCRFKNCNRVISSMSYGGTTPPANASWFYNVYDYNGTLRFRNFNIVDNDFSYIHQSICWAAPPSLSTIISGNNVHDCYTMITAFFLFMATPNNTAGFWQGKITQSVTSNTFIRVRPLNPGANFNTSIIRTSGSAIVNDNVYLDITQQAVYISGGNSTFNNNSVTKFTESSISTSCPVVLIKVVDDEGMVEISGNTIIAPQSGLVEMEGSASLNINNNFFIGGTKSRILIGITTELSSLKIYSIKNLTQFGVLLSGKYDTTQTYVVGSLIYFDKRINLWTKMQSTLPNSFVFSKGYLYPISSSPKSQHVAIQNNPLLEIESITNLNSSNTTVFLFRSISVINNSVYFCTNLHIGNKVTVQEYICTGNYFRNGYLIMASNSAFSDQVKSLFFENNNIAKTLGGILLFAFKDLVFRNNTFFSDEDVSNSTYYLDYGNYYIAGPPPVYYPPGFYGVTLKGYPNSKITVEGNQLPTIHSRYGGLLLDQPYDAEIKNNIFDMNAYGFTHYSYFRNAVKIDATGDINSIIFTDNTIYPDPSLTGSTYVNRILEFDTTTNKNVASLVVNNNKVPLNPTLIKNTILATNRVVSKYYKGTNFYDSYIDTFASPAPTIINPL